MSGAKLTAQLGLDGKEFNQGLKNATAEAQKFSSRMASTKTSLSTGKGAFGGGLNEGARAMIQTLATGEMSMERMLGIAKGLGESFASVGGKLGLIGLAAAAIYGTGKAIGWLAAKAYDAYHKVEEYTVNVRRASDDAKKSMVEWSRISMEKLIGQMKDLSKESERLEAFSRSAKSSREKNLSVQAEKRQIAIRENNPEGPGRDRAMAVEEGLQRTLELENESLSIQSELNLAKEEAAKLQKINIQQAEKENALQAEIAKQAEALKGGNASEGQIKVFAVAREQENALKAERDTLEAKMDANKKTLDAMLAQERTFNENKAQIKENIEKATAQKVREIAEKDQKEKEKKAEEEAKLIKEKDDNFIKALKAKVNAQNEIELQAAKDIARVSSGADIRVGALSPSTSSLSSIGGHLGNTAQAARFATQDRGRVTQEKIAEINVKMKDALESIDKKMGEEE